MRAEEELEVYSKVKFEHSSMVQQPHTSLNQVNPTKALTYTITLTKGTEVLDSDHITLSGVVCSVIIIFLYVAVDSLLWSSRAVKTSPPAKMIHQSKTRK